MSSNLIRWGGLAAMLVGASFVAADLLSLSISPKFPSSESLGSEPYTIRSVLKLVGTALAIGSFWATAFFAPAISAMDPVAFDVGEGPPGRLADAFVVTIATFVLGWMLFRVAARRARVYPRGAALLLILGSPLALGTLLVVGFPTGVFFSAAVA